MAQRNDLGLRLVRIAAVYLMLGLVLGLVMGMRHDFTLLSVHSHLALLGWATMALAGLVYRAWPELAATGLARWHFRLHNLGLPILMVGLGASAYGNEAAGPFVGIASVVVLAGLALFSVNLWSGAKSS